MLTIYNFYESAQQAISVDFPMDQESEKEAKEFAKSFVADSLKQYRDNENYAKEFMASKEADQVAQAPTTGE